MVIMMNNKNSKRNYNPKSKSFTTSTLQHYLCVFCFMFLPFCFFKSLIGAEISSEQNTPNNFQGPRLSNPGIFLDPNSSIRRQLLQAEIGFDTVKKDKATKDELQRIIEQIRSITFKTDKRTIESEPVIVPKVVPIEGPNETLPDTAVQEEQEEKEIERKLPYEPITDETLRMLRQLSKHPEKLDNPFELGETLFLSGNLKEAVMFYQEALKRKSSGDTSPDRDRAWVLFQIGNCLWNNDPPTAIKMYGQLITEHPNSPWKDLAEARSKLLNWYQTDEPHKLIAEPKL